MPGRNGTGPLGMGPLTGRGLGYCAVSRAPGYANRLPGYGARGRRGRFGRGYGYGFRPFYGQGYGYYNAIYAPEAAYDDYYNQPNPEAEREFLTSQIDSLNEQLSHLKQRLAELEGADADKEKNKE